MRQADNPTRIALSIHIKGRPKPQSRAGRRKHCLCCAELFEPDPRSKGKQRYCSKTGCQTKRQRQNESDWRIRNPDCLAEQYKQTRLWHKARPDYSRQRRKNNPRLLQQNLNQTKLRMRKIRGKKMFDKSKVILTQLVGGKIDKCYLSNRSKWLLVRLTKASLLSKPGSVWDNRKTFKQVNNCLPRGWLYDIAGMF
jgi:hypothetical protein